MTNADGDKVCVAQAWQYSRVLGELSVTWENNGTVSSCSGTPHLLLGNSIIRDDGTDDGYQPPKARNWPPFGQPSRRTRNSAL